MENKQKAMGVNNEQIIGIGLAIIVNLSKDSKIENTEVSLNKKNTSK